MLFFGDLDPCLTNFVRQNISPGDTIVDVGANLGVITLAAAAIIGDSGKAIAIEPNSFVVSAMKKSVELNSFLNIEIVNKAVSDFTGKAALSIPDQNFVQATISAPTERGEVCHVMRLDEFSLRRHVRLLKIDAEGHEHRALKGQIAFLQS